MLFSLALILISGFAFAGLMQKLKLPPLLGMMLAGILLGPHALNLIAPGLLTLSADLRQIALIVILLRAGLSLNLNDLRKVGRPAVLMCFIPATFELVAIAFLAPRLLGVSPLEAAIMGAVLAAVSPAVVVPRMLKLMDEGYGRAKGIPQLIMAGASVDDVYVIVLLTSFLSMYQGEGFAPLSLIKVPLSILTGLALGILTGIAAVGFFKKLHMRDTVKVLLLLALSFLFVSLEEAVKARIPFSGLLAVMALGATVLRTYPALAKRISGKCAKLWVGAELFLFVLVGAAVDIGYIAQAGAAAVLLIFAALLCRMAGVWVCLIKSGLNAREQLFTAIAYLPKATVQAAVGGIPLLMGIPSGNIILSVAVLSIVITAPLGAIGVDRTYRKLLER